MKSVTEDTIWVQRKDWCKKNSGRRGKVLLETRDQIPVNWKGQSTAGSYQILFLSMKTSLCDVWFTHLCASVLVWLMVKYETSLDSIPQGFLNSTRPADRDNYQSLEILFCKLLPSSCFVCFTVILQQRISHDNYIQHFSTYRAHNWHNLWNTQ